MSLVWAEAGYKSSDDCTDMDMPMGHGGLREQVYWRKRTH